MTAGLRLSKADSPQTDEERAHIACCPYATVVGTLLYLAMCTRPDIIYVVIILCRFIADPARRHIEVVKH